MSRFSHLELRPSDSEDLSCLDSLSLPSEPPDIRNWFSSYVYESPELNTLDGLQDSGGCGRTFVEEVKNGKSGDSQLVGESDDALLASFKKSSDGIKFDESDEFECDKSAALVPGLSEPLSLSSEPPDIKNWFSSYFYESPPLDTIHDFAISNYNEREDGKLCNVQTSCRQDKKDVTAFVNAKERKELCSQSRNSAVVVKCTNLVKDTKLDYQSVCKDIHDVALKSMPSTPSQLTSDNVSDPTLSGQRTGNSDHGYAEMSGNTNTYNNDYDGNLQCSFADRRRPMLLKTENNTCSQDGKSVHSLIGRIDPVKDGPEKEDLHEILSPGTLDMTVSKEDSRGRPIGRRSNEKENEESELQDNGFISIRKKSRQANAGKVTRSVRAEDKYVRNAIKPKINHEKDAKIVRKVLSEISNFRSPNTQESSGKWRCPQKNKPDLDPPLKQLRLDQWFYRV